MSESRRFALSRSSTLRLSLLYLGLLLASVGALFSFFFWSTTTFLEEHSGATIATEVAGLRDRFNSNGLPGLTVLITNRVGRNSDGQSLYLLADSNYKPVVGNLPAWPLELRRDGEGGGAWREFEATRVQDGSTRNFRARAQIFSLKKDFKLLIGSDFHLLVGRDVQDLVDIRSRMLLAFGWGLAITVTLGAFAGVWLSRRFAGRIEQINVASREVMAGNLSVRVPESGRRDDLAELAVHWNRMLDQIETLMAGVRHVSDNIAHDLRTPLARLRNELEVAHTATPVEQKEIREHLEHSILEADGLLSTFSALLRIARIEAGERRAEFKTVELSGILRDVAELYEPLAEERQQTLQLQVATAMWVHGDRDLLFQAFANLIDNAVKHSPVGGEISVELDPLQREGAEFVRVAISDRGPGIPGCHHEEVLNRFFRLEESRSTPGNGLGLALVAAVATLHDAVLSLEEADPGLRVNLDFSSKPPPTH